MNDLENYFNTNKKRQILKWAHYFEIYDRHLKKYRGKEVVVVEIGVFHGGSLQMWQNYFGVKAKIYGIDVNPRCQDLEEQNIKILIGSQSDPKFLNEVKNSIPKIDILIDDGGHYMNQQIMTFKELYSHLKHDGIYICEDLHTSYWLKYGGGYKRRGTFIEFSKNLIDYLNAYHSEQNSFKVNEYTNSMYSVHYYDSILVLEKRIKEKPYRIKSGFPYFNDVSNKNNRNSNIQLLKYKIKLTINKVLQFFRLPHFYYRQ